MAGNQAEMLLKIKTIKIIVTSELKEENNRSARKRQRVPLHHSRVYRVWGDS
jgi:hypothetical protein